MNIALFYLFLNLLIFSACSKHHQHQLSSYDEYRLISLTLKVENINKRVHINSFICDGDEPKLKVVASLNKVAQEISKVLFDEAMLQDITANKKIEHGSYIFEIEEITYSKKGTFFYERLVSFLIFERLFQYNFA